MVFHIVYAGSERARVDGYMEHLEQSAIPGRSVAQCTDEFRTMFTLFRSLGDPKLQLLLMLQYFRCLSFLYFNDNSSHEVNLGRAAYHKMAEMWENALNLLEKNDADEWCDLCFWFQSNF